jgi:hypothetical protein
MKAQSLSLAALTLAMMLGLYTGPARAANPASYLTGRYLIWDGEETLNVTFDGAGNYSGTASFKSGPDAPLCVFDTSGTYTANADGTFSIVYTIFFSSDGVTCTPETYTGQIASGSLGPDGNTLVLNDLAAGQEGDNLVGIKLGEIANDNYGAGVMALSADTTGTGNTATGGFALQANQSGSNNTAFGAYALYSNTSGKGNAAQGVNSMYSNTSGIRNLGIGNNALYNNNGSYNIGLGFDAGYNVTNGNNNIEIGSQGSASDNGAIQIGVQGTQTSATIAGIYGTQVTGSAVYVTSTGQLGVQGSSEQFKTDITTMPDMSSKLDQLRPVTFRYKTDSKGVQQYGLIAEEVEKIYPELVIRDDSGRILGVHYEELAPMLLGAMQRERREMAGRIAEYDAQTKKQREMLAALSQQNAQQAAQIRELNKERAEYATRAEVRELQSQLKAALAKLQAEDALLTRR